MDFLDPKKVRAHRIRLLIGYCLATVALILASVILLFTAFGYTINKSGEVIQNGLVFVDAHPEQAKMYLNGVDKGGTDGRFVLETGNYTLELKRDGYRSWKRDFTLSGGQIVRLVYPFLFPEKIERRDVLALSAAPDFVSQSPDRRWVVLHSATVPTSFQVLDAGNDALKTVAAELPLAVIGKHAGAQHMEAVEWSTDNRHLLMKYTYEGGFDYVVFDRQDPNLSFNVTQTFGKSYGEVALRDKKFDQLYLHDTVSGDLLAGKVADKTATPVAAGVLAFWPYKGDTLLYTTNVGAAADTSLVKLKIDTTVYDIRQILRGDTYLLNMAEFDGDTYVAAGTTADGKLYVYKNPLDALKSKQKPVTMRLLKVAGAQYLSFSANTRFLALQGGSNFAVYDFETTQFYRYDVGLPLAAGQKATWMDGHRLVLVSQGNAVVFDYDGINKQTLVPADAAYTPLFDRDYNQLFTVSPSLADASKLAIVRGDINIGKK